MRARLITVLVSVALAACGDGFGAETPDGLAFDETRADAIQIAVKGVPFSAGEATATLDLVNRAAIEILATDAGAGARAATKIVEARPIETLTALAATSYVGPATLTKLKQYAVIWSHGNPDAPQCGAGGRFDEVSFSGAEECRALDIANSAGYLQLMALDATARRTMYDLRPWKSLRELATQSGIGKGTMTSLRALASEWAEGRSGSPDTVELLMRMRPMTPDGRAPQVSIERGRIVGRVAGTPCLWLADARADGSAGPRMQLCAQASTPDVESLFRRALTSNAIVRARAQFRVRDNGLPYLLAYAADFLRITGEGL